MTHTNTHTHKLKWNTTKYNKASTINTTEPTEMETFEILKMVPLLCSSYVRVMNHRIKSSFLRLSLLFTGIFFLALSLASAVILTFPIHFYLSSFFISNILLNAHFFCTYHTMFKARTLKITSTIKYENNVNKRQTDTEKRNRMRERARNKGNERMLFASKGEKINYGYKTLN